MGGEQKMRQVIGLSPDSYDVEGRAS